MKRTKVDCHYDTIVLIIVGYLVTIQTCENLNVLMFCPQKKTLNIIPTLNLLDLDSNPRPVPPDMAPAKKTKIYINIFVRWWKKNVCSEKNKKICTYLCAKNKGQERLSNLCRVRLIKVTSPQGFSVELVSKELNHLAAILHVYAGGLNFMK